MSSNSYTMVFCVKCRQKTGWLVQATITKGRNNVPGLRGRCCKCKCNKYTFVTHCFYKKFMQKCNRSKPKLKL